MSKDVLVNRIDVQFNDEAIDKNFDFLKINCDLRGKQNYGKAVTTIYEHVKPLSLCKIKDGYAVLVRKGVIHSLSDPHFTVIPQIAADMPISTKAKLLIGALPVMQAVDQKCSEGMGLYYLVDVEAIREVEVLRTYEVKIEWEQQKHLVLSIESATFTPVSYHTNAHGELYGDCTHLPRLKFDQWTQELSRVRGGDYIRKKHRDRNMSGEMVSLDTKNPAKFWRSKMGILATFMDDAERYLSDYLKVRFQTLSPGYRVRFKDRDVKAAYESINKLLSGYAINLINLTDCDTSELVRALERDGFDVTKSNNVDYDALNLAIHHNREHYESKQEVDPYRSLRLDKGIIIQSAYPETLIRKGKLSQSEYEACKKELFIKLETASQEFKFVKPDGNWQFVVFHDVKDKERYYDSLSWSDGKLIFERFDENEAQERFLLDLPRQLKNGEHAAVDLSSGETYIFEDTKYVALPQYQELASVMSELANGYASGIQRVWVEEFLNLLKCGEIELTNQALVKERLETLLARKPTCSTLYKEDIFNDKENKIAYKGSLQTFFDWVATEKGLRLGASLKGQDAGFIEASLGLLYNDEERLYFVGDKDNVKSVPRFCRIRRILTDAEEVPVELLRMMEVFHVRHKQATIYPFPFKHLREMSKIYDQD
ncbi:hypothetical protein JYB88_03500 [Shewanella cyperi]|uniref:Uncharacterized protein n=1 Tax=Shewanella cyperi TaxID=2814292 RepID=A0A974XLT1_9GAMM|nr:hypothetical protein [Shewanella cyperi]QSX30739.1 hypothetical protein JYB88_03500 [Shewanella cyperi]